MWKSYHRKRVLLGLGALVCLLVFYYASSALAIPAEPGFSMSFVQQPQPLAELAFVLVAMLVCALLGTLIAGTIRFDAGLFVACVGLMALSLRGGPMRYVLMAADSPGIYLQLLVELVGLYAMVLAAWGVLWWLYRSGWLLHDHMRDGVEDVEQGLPEMMLAAAFQTVVMTVSMLLLAQTDQKAQVLLAVGISSFLGAIAAHAIFPVRPSVWFWIGPVLVGMIGYVYAYLNPQGWAIGDVRGMLAPLARPLPVDYASVGPAGAILGYWMSRRWQRDRQTAEAGAQQEQQAQQ